MAGWRASTQTLSLTLSVPHRSSAVTPQLPHASSLGLRLRAGSIQRERWAGGGRVREREMTGIKISSESQPHLLLPGSPKAPGCRHHSPPSRVPVVGPPPFLSVSQSRTSLAAQER